MKILNDLTGLFDFRISIQYIKNMIKKVLNFIKENNMLQNGDSVVLGVSGGADSICMLYVLKEISKFINLKLVVVHVHHHIRGKEADGDMEYVRKICDKEHIPCEIFHIDAKKEAIARGMSEEEAGRVCRYECFAKVQEKYNANKISVAHNLNDNSETILFNLFRGTGIKGISGIPMQRDNIVRPLLCVSRKEIEKYLEENHISYRTDKTNFETEYSRNKLRLELIPYIKENINKKAEYNIVNAGKMLGEIEDYLEIETNKTYDEYVDENEEGIFISLKAFEIHPAIAKRIVRKGIEKKTGKLKDVTAAHVESIINLAKLEVSKSVNLPYNIKAIKKYKGILLSDLSDIKNEKIKEIPIIVNNELINENPYNGKFKIDFENNGFSVDDIQELLYTKWIDCDKIGSLTLRNRKEGDYLVVNDFGSKKKLKEYFINEKIPKEDRDKVLLLADGNHIVWIVGYRMSSYYKVNSNTRNIIKIEFYN